MSKRPKYKYSFYLDNGQYPTDDVLARYGHYSTLARAVAAAKKLVRPHGLVAIAGTIKNDRFSRQRVINWDYFGHRHHVTKWGK